MDMSSERWSVTSRYIRELFRARDPQLDTLMHRAVAAGLPDIAVSPETGQLLTLLARTTNSGNGPRHALEIGTLAGYSGIHVARALAPGGRLFTIEPNPAHADFAQKEFAQAGLAGQIEIIRRPALTVLPSLPKLLGSTGIDFAFIDAVKTEYPAYFEHLRDLMAPGSLMVFDNALGSNSWWIDAPEGRSADRDAVDLANRTVAHDAGFESTLLPIGNGVLVARRIR